MPKIILDGGDKRISFSISIHGLLGADGDFHSAR
jgi:hypothetical protein